MARELYNWDQVRSYAIIALCNLENKNIEKNATNYIRELDSLQTSIGKDGSIGYANRLLHKSKIN